MRSPALSACLLHVALDLRNRPGRGTARVLTELAPSAALAQQIPVLVKLSLDGMQLLLLLLSRQLAGSESSAQLVLGFDQLIDLTEDVLVVHGSIPSLMAPPILPPPPTAAAAVSDVGARALRTRGGVGTAEYVATVQLTRKRIIVAAMDLIEKDGIEAISMQRLATELGCGLVSLYSYVPSKAALLDGVANAVMSHASPPVLGGASWQEQIRVQARTFRELARAHPRCAMVLVTRRASSAAVLRPVEQALTTLRSAGFDPRDAMRIVRAVTMYVMGSLLSEFGIAPVSATDDADDRPLRLRRDEFPHLTALTALTAEPSAGNADADFEFGLDLLVRSAAEMQAAGAAC